MKQPANSEPWREALTEQQRKILNAACGDLSEQISWHGNKLSKNDWRHFISGMVLGWRMMPAFNMGLGAPGFIMLGGSSLDLKKEQCSLALDMVFSLGDDPSSQGLKSPPVRWCAAVVKARWLAQEEFAA